MVGTSVFAPSSGAAAFSDVSKRYRVLSGASLLFPVPFPRLFLDGPAVVKPLFAEAFSIVPLDEFTDGHLSGFPLFIGDAAAIVRIHV